MSLERNGRKPGRNDSALTMVFTREDLVEGLHALIRELHARGHSGRLQIVGGAAIALTVDSERVATQDIDGPLVPAETVRSAARTIAIARGWRDDWINDSAAQFLPNGFGQRSAQWATIYHDELVAIEVATSETLLAMKLHAAQKRLVRDADDIYVLLRATGIATAEEAEELYGDFYPGDQFNRKLVSLVEDILAMPHEGPFVPPDFPNLGDIN